MNKKQVFKLGFIGGGCDSAIGVTHKIASQMDNKFKLICGCFSTHPDINLKTAQDWNIDENRIYGTYQELIKNEKNNLDAIVILTPTPTHYEIIKHLLAANIPIICEKALVTSSSKAREIQELVSESKAFLRVTFNYTGYPMLRELKYKVQQSEIGQLEQIHIHMPQESYMRVDKNNECLIPQEWRQTDYEIPTISLDLGVHVHNIIDYISDEIPYRTVALEESFGDGNGLINNILVLAKYTNNLTCHIWFSKSVAGESNGLKVDVYGSKGRLKWVQMDPEHLTMFDNKGHQTIINRSSVSSIIASQLTYNRFKAGHPSGFIEAFANYYNDLYTDLLNYKQNQTHNSRNTFGINESIEGLKFLEAVSYSSKNMEWIEV